MLAAKLDRADECIGFLMFISVCSSRPTTQISVLLCTSHRYPIIASKPFSFNRSGGTGLEPMPRHCKS
jgi:hypothetical protein